MLTGKLSDRASCRSSMLSAPRSGFDSGQDVHGVCEAYCGAAADTHDAHHTAQHEGKQDGDGAAGDQEPMTGSTTHSEPCTMTDRKAFRRPQGITGLGSIHRRMYSGTAAQPLIFTSSAGREAEREACGEAACMAEG